MVLDPKIWGPHFWFVLHTITLNYPLFPNDTVKKKYYDFIHNLPLFIPITDMGNYFSTLLDSYPVTPYLDSRESFIKWLHFIHNKVNLSLGIPEKSLEETLHDYYEQYKTPEIVLKDNIIKKEKCIYFGVVVSLLLLSIIVYKK